MTRKSLFGPARSMGPALLLVLWAFLSASVASAKRERLHLELTSLFLPGAPSTVISADLNNDGRRDLAVVVAYTEWDQLTIEETTEMDDIEGLVEVMTIVPALADRRELHVFLGGTDGLFKPLDHILPLEKDVLALEKGHDGAPVVAVTDRGLAALRLESGRLRLEHLIDDHPALAGSGNFLPRLGMTVDLDGDSQRDVFFPADRCPSIYRGAGDSFQAGSSCLSLPTAKRRAGRSLTRFYPMPEYRDVDGDRLPDLVFPEFEDGLEFFVLPNAGQGRFEDPVGPLRLNGIEASQDDEDEPGIRLAYFGDLDGDGRAEYVAQESLGAEDAGARQEFKEAKRPPFRYHLYRSRPDLSAEDEPFRTFDALGYTFTGSDDDEDEGISIPGGFQDLDGDGRLDLLALTLDFSLFQAVRIMTTQTISIGLDFHIYCQSETGDFKAVEGLDLSGKFKIDLNNIQMRQLSLFDGDFDGDGRADFVQLGRGKTVSIHRGQPGCRYPSKPDLTLKLSESPRNLALVDIEDYDADGYSDLLIVQPNKIEEAGVTPPVRLDLYLSAQAGAPAGGAAR